MIASYIDEVESEEDRVEACSALAACFKSMADMTSRMIANSVMTRRIFFLKTVGFSSKATPAKLLNLPLSGAQLFGEFSNVKPVKNAKTDKQDYNDRRGTDTLSNFRALPAKQGGKNFSQKNYKKGTIICLLLEEIKCAIEPVRKNVENQGYYSTIFLVPKRQEVMRPISNLKPLN
ncbi:unnamed protein product [Mytilus coruscus]|uniref:Uncharacterized protein n=1 Tax=Mytilus coruscus TaxID=42192 RepID=A0A6J8DVE8_MYTCO|nr:unnamed protein product [Mytilus coruscus]